MNKKILPNKSKWEVWECPFSQTTSEVWDQVSDFWNMQTTKMIVLERIWHDMLPFLKSIDFYEFLSSYLEWGVQINQLEQSFINRCFTDVLNSFINDSLELSEKEIQGLMKLEWYKNAEDIKRYVLLEPLSISLKDSFNVYMLHKNFWFEEAICKRFLFINMQDGMGVEDITMEIDMQSLEREEVKRIIGNTLNDKTKKKQDDCPFFKSPWKKEWLIEIWRILETEFLPALQKVFWNIENWNKETLFYLGRYNKVKK